MDIKLIHTLAVMVFLASFIVKIGLMIAGQKGLLEWYTRTLRFFDMAVSVVFLATGAYLWSEWNFVLSISWFNTKFVLILAAIPAGIVALRKESKLIGIVSVLMFLYILVISYTKSNLF